MGIPTTSYSTLEWSKQFLNVVSREFSVISVKNRVKLRISSIYITVSIDDIRVW